MSSLDLERKILGLPLGAPLLRAYSLLNRRIGDILFGAQIIGAILFCGAQFFRSLVDLRGVSLAQFVMAATFLFFHLALGLGAHRMGPSRLTRQAIATYCTWIVLILAIIAAVFANGTYRWSVQDWTTVWTAAGLTVIVLGFGQLRRLSIKDPEIKAFLAIAYKSVPQVLLAWKIWVEGGSGIPGLSIIVGHATILIRLGQLALMVREKSLDRNRKWLAISETANELSWVIATIAWCTF